jgi:hypothetical protein
VAEFESHPELIAPITDLTVLTPHYDLIEELLASIFPPTSAAHDNLYAVSLPFKFKTVYSSKIFRHLFIKAGSDEIKVPDTQTGMDLSRERLQFAYRLILKKFCGHHNHQTTRSVHPYVDPHSGLTKYLELKFDARFVDVNAVGDPPKFPENVICNPSGIITIEELMEQIPIDNFVFDGIAIVHVNDVTEQEVISLIKNSLLNINAFSDAEVYQELEKHIQSLIGLKDLKIGVTPFFKVNDHYVYSELHNSNSLLFKHFHSIVDKDEISDCCKILFKESTSPVVFETINEEMFSETDYLQYYYMEGGRSLIICPLKQNNELIGILEIVSNIPGKLRHTHITKIEAAIPLLTLALEKI